MSSYENIFRKITTIGVEITLVGPAVISASSNTHFCNIYDREAWLDSSDAGSGIYIHKFSHIWQHRKN